MSGAREEAIEVMARAMCAWDGLSWDEARLPLDEDGNTDAANYAAMAEEALSALLSPQSTECETCDGQGADWDACIAHAKKVGGLLRSDDPAHYMADFPCPSCNGSGQVEKGPIAYLSAELEQVTWTRSGAAKHPWMLLSYAAQPTPVYRLPSESTNGVKDEH